MTFRSILQALYLAVRPTLTTGDESAIMCDSDGVLLNRAMPPGPSTAPTKYPPTTVAAAKSGVIKATAGLLFSISGRNDGAALLYLMLFNASALPANGTAPNWPAMPIDTLTGGNPFGFAFDGGLLLSTGIVWAASTTADTLTLVGTNDFRVGALYS